MTLLLFASLFLFAGSHERYGCDNFPVCSTISILLNLFSIHQRPKIAQFVSHFAQKKATDATAQQSTVP